ncbi:MAG TPA: mechanosensitive ion channel family protein [Acidimicrobiales bacterium]|nr:mechanosensitive ion channel family protein [Acidimicrobiales bacterium]
MISKLAGWIFLFASVLVSLAVTFPSIRPVNLLAGLGFFSVAIGFAFQDILENTLSGVLLRFRQPFRSGDEIAVAGYEGTVEGITIRETRIRQYDGQLLLVPNRDVYKNVIRVQTSRADRLLTIVVGVAYDADLQTVRRVVLDSLRDVDTVAAEPQPEALVQQLGGSAVEIGVRFWSNSRQLNAVRARDDAISAVKAALDAAGIDIPPAIIELKSSDNETQIRDRTPHQYTADVLPAVEKHALALPRWCLPHTNLRRESPHTHARRIDESSVPRPEIVHADTLRS